MEPKNQKNTQARLFLCEMGLKFKLTLKLKVWVSDKYSSTIFVIFIYQENK